MNQELIAKTRPVVRNKKTGITLLDRNLDGGIPEGSLVCVYANPKSMAEVFLYQFATARKTYYYNTSRNFRYIIENMNSLNLETDKLEFVDVYSQYYLDESGRFILEDRYRDKEIFDYIDHSLNTIIGKDEDANLIFDHFSFFLNLEVSTSMKEWLMNRLYTISKETGHLVYLYVIKDLQTPELAYKVLTLSDVIFDIELERLGERVTNKLAIPKIRGRTPVSDLIRFKVSEGIQIDTSRDIA
jgi:KaiC/GvpD/RAD55 family RecA-like ATPase